MSLSYRQARRAVYREKRGGNFGSKLVLVLSIAVLVLVLELLRFYRKGREGAKAERLDC